MAVDDYGQLVDRENINREEGGVDASGMQAAIAALVVGDSTPEDRHPEKYAAFLLETVFLSHLMSARIATWLVVSGMGELNPFCCTLATLAHLPCTKLL